MSNSNSSGLHGGKIQLQAMSLVSATLTDVLDAQDLPAALLAALRDALPPAGAGLFWLHEPGTGAFHAAAVTGGQLPGLRGLTLRADEAFLGVAPERRAQGALLAAGAGTAALRPAQRAALTRGLGDRWLARELLVLPVRVGDRTLGAIWLLAAPGPAGFGARELPFVQRLVDLAALALDRAQREAAAAQVDASRQAGLVRAEALATLSHEMRTPLAAIKGYATALLLEEAEWSAEEQKEFLELIDRECDGLQAMIGEILDSALIDAGQLGIEPEPMRLARVVREIAEEVQRQAPVHRLVTDLPADVPLLEADPRRVRQVLRNVLDNAVKYSPDGGLIVIRVEVRASDVVVSVADQGVGIAPENLIPLFDKYFRVKSSTGRRVPGTGLGLPVARAIVEAHGGRIWAESRLGHGTTIHFSLPRPSAGAPVDEQPSTPATGEP